MLIGAVLTRGCDEEARSSRRCRREIRAGHDTILKLSFHRVQVL